MVSELDRQSEEAADETARFDMTIRFAPRAVGIAFRLRAVSDLCGAGTKGTRSLMTAFEGMSGIPSPDQTELARWSRFMDEEERRAMSGAPPSASRLERRGSTLDASTRAAIDLALRSAVPRRPALLRSIDVAASIADHSLADAAAALVLCAEGRIDRLWLLPFHGVEPAARDASVTQWRTEGSGDWPTIALGALIERARTCRAAVVRATESSVREDDSLSELGRASISARRALCRNGHRRAVTMPSLAESLELSRPAAADALDRLTELGLAAEITGRKRDRVYAYAAALSAADTLG